MVYADQRDMQVLLGQIDRLSFGTWQKSEAYLETYCIFGYDAASNSVLRQKLLMKPSDWA